VVNQGILKIIKINKKDKNLSVPESSPVYTLERKKTCLKHFTNRYKTEYAD
jgi:hypothetical protein